MADKQFSSKLWLIPLLAIGVIVFAGLSIGVFYFPPQQVSPLRSRVEALDRIKPNNFSELEKLAQQQKALIDAENAVRTPLIQALVGVLATIATSTAAWIAYQNYRATQEKNTADRFSKAIEQLGNENIHVRLGGIFALEQIANTEDKYYLLIMENLTAYVRERSPWPQKKAPQDSSSPISRLTTPVAQKIPVVEIDIEAIMTVISRRRKSYVDEPARLNLTQTDLQGLIAKPGADFQGIDFSEANLSWSKLKNVELSQTLFKNTDITGVHFTEVVPKDLPAPLKRLAQFGYDAKNLTLEQLSEVIDHSYKSAILPSYLEIDSDESQQKLKEFAEYTTIAF